MTKNGRIQEWMYRVREQSLLFLQSLGLNCRVVSRLRSSMCHSSFDYITFVLVEHLRFGCLQLLAFAIYLYRRMTESSEESRETI